MNRDEELAYLRSENQRLKSDKSRFDDNWRDRIETKLDQVIQHKADKSELALLRKIVYPVEAIYGAILAWLGIRG